ncbi:hypothetical protein [Cognatishimia sp. MH4019]|uniref:hypothetical protein n=1 Tax=Cognatishimia sp. MH4019 TaxID=2854030 RepID=UPI001CD4B5F5|nr:hypothetical protein [Cognatishimia sp. MH4019]
MVDVSDLTHSAQRMGRIMTGAVALLWGAALALAIGALITPASLGEALATVSGFQVNILSGWQIAVLVCIAAVHLGVWIVLLMMARRMFENLAQGAPEPAGSVAGRLSYWLWAMLGWGLISQMLVSLVVTWGFPEGERAISLGVGTSHILMALAALLASFMARAFALGAELWRDTQEVV